MAFNFTSLCLNVFFIVGILFLFVLQSLDAVPGEIRGLPSSLEGPDSLVLDADGVRSLRLIEPVDMSSQPCFGRRKDSI